MLSFAQLFGTFTSCSLLCVSALKRNIHILCWLSGNEFSPSQSLVWAICVSDSKHNFFCFILTCVSRFFFKKKNKNTLNQYFIIARESVLMRINFYSFWLQTKKKENFVIKKKKKNVFVWSIEKAFVSVKWPDLFG